MTRPIAPVGPSCFAPSLAELEASSETLGKAGQDAEAKLESAFVNTAKVAGLCLGGERLATASCIVAVAQHLEGLFALERASEAYAKAVADHERALAEHLTCLEELGSKD